MNNQTIAILLLMFAAILPARAQASRADDLSYRRDNERRAPTRQPAEARVPDELMMARKDAPRDNDERF